MAVTINSASFFSQENESITLAWARNVVFLNLQAASNWATNNVYYLELEIGVDSVGSIIGFPVYSKTLVEEPNQNGQIVFELQQAMQDYSLINIPVPDFNTNLIQQHEAPTFYIKIWEVSDSGRVLQELPRMQGATGNRKYLVDAIDAALDRENFTYQQQFDWIFGDANEGGRKFLTSVEDPKSTTKKANEFLYFFGSQPNRDLSVYCKIYYDDGTEETVTLFEYMAGYNIQCIPTRYDFIKSKSTQPTKNIIVWGVYAGYNNFRISEFFRYELHEQQNREAKYFLAKNSLGVFDTLVCAGDYEDFLEAESETASKRDFANYAITDAQKFIVSKTGKRGGTANTAFLNKLQSVVKQYFTLSREMLLQSDKGFIPIIAEKIKQVYSIKNNNLIGYSFEYVHAHNVQHYTNKIFRPILGEVPTPPSLPKFVIKNTGPSGYVRVEYDSIVVDIPPNTEEGIEINEGVSIKVTWLTVNPDTLLLDASLINISYPNYAFPSRIDTAIFDSVLQAGTTVVAIPDESGIKKARSYTFTMPNNDYFAEVKFREVTTTDIDFENPICYDATTPTKVQSRDGLLICPQSTPSLRGIVANNALNLAASQRYGIASTTFTSLHKHFFVLEMKDFASSIFIQGGIGNNNYHSFGSTGFQFFTNVSFAYYIPFGDRSLVPLNQNLVGIISATGFRIKAGTYSSPITNGRLTLLQIIGGGSGAIAFKRYLGLRETLTTNENTIIEQKIGTKYSV